MIIRTLSSAAVATVCASTTRWANLMQQILTADTAPSHMLSIRDLMAVIRSQVGVS